MADLDRVRRSSEMPSFHRSVTTPDGMCLTCAYNRQAGGETGPRHSHDDQQLECYCIYAAAAASVDDRLDTKSNDGAPEVSRSAGSGGRVGKWLRSTSVPTKLSTLDRSRLRKANDHRHPPQSPLRVGLSRRRRARLNADARALRSEDTVDVSVYGGSSIVPRIILESETTVQFSSGGADDDFPVTERWNFRWRKRGSRHPRLWPNSEETVENVVTDNDGNYTNLVKIPSLPSVPQTNLSPTGKRRWRTVTNFFRNLTLRTSPASDDSLSPEVSDERVRSASSDEQIGSRLPYMDDRQQRQKWLEVGCNHRRSSWRSLSSGSTDSLTLPDVNGKSSRRNFDLDQFRRQLRTAEETDNWEYVNESIHTLFKSLDSIGNAFTVKCGTGNSNCPPDCVCDVDIPKLCYLYDLMERMHVDTNRNLVRILDKQLRPMKTEPTGDQIKGFFCLLLNPQFNLPSSYVQFAYLLRRIVDLSNEQLQHFVFHFGRLERSQFRQLIQRLQNFITYRQLASDENRISADRCSSWIPSAVRVLALLNAANGLSKPPIVPYVDFYNSSFDRVDLMTYYNAWQQSTECIGFNLCQFPFVLSIAAKRTVLQKDSANQMLMMAHKTWLAKLKRQEATEMEELFLVIVVRRSHLVSDSLNEIDAKKHELKKKLRVQFEDEPGLDLGGLTKEWFLLLVRKIFKPDYGMFTFNKLAQVHWFSNSLCENYQEFNLIGNLMGLAVYNGIILDIHFPPICYRKLLSPAVVPDDVNATVGVCAVSLEDLRQVSPELANGLQELLDYDGDVEEDFGLTFEVNVNEFDQIVTHQLKPNGNEVPVTNLNRQEYVSLYVDFVLNSSIYQQFKAFYQGFHAVCASNALIMLRPEEVELLVCGNPEFDLSKLVDVTEYSGYTSSDITIQNFWEVAFAMSEDLQKKLLLFATGSDRIPVGGMNEMNFKIARSAKSDMLPTSHTCFNQLILPDYQDIDVLQLKLTIAIQNAEGFGLK